MELFGKRHRLSLTLFLYYTLFTGTVCGSGKSEADDNFRHGAPWTLLRQSIGFLSSDSNAELIDKLRTFQREIQQTDVVESARNILKSGVLNNLHSSSEIRHRRFANNGVDSDFLAADNNITTPSSGSTTSSENTTVVSESTTMSYNLTTTNEHVGTTSSASTPNPSPAPAPVNHLCVNHTAALLEALVARKPWAIKMIDADGKPGPNIEGIHLFWVGDYEECTGVVATENTNALGVDTVLFKGRYCTAVFPLQPTDAHVLIPATPPSGLRIGLCVPDSCNGGDITLLINEVLASRNIAFRVGLTTCQAETVDYDAKAIAVLFICSLFLLALAAGTVYDVALVQWPRWRAVSGEQSLDPLDRQAAGNNDYSSIGNGSATSVNLQHSGERQSLLGGGEGKKNSSGGGKSLGVLGQVLVAFSMYSNGKKILNASHSPGSITCIHGIRFLSMTWVILGHTFIFGLTTAANYATYLKKSLGLWSFQAVTAAPVTVDTFFVLSGLLVTYLILKEMDKRDGKVQWFLFYFHRFWRLTPPYALVMMVYVPLFPYLATGANWPQEGTELHFCRDSWWTNLLYINNFVKVKEMCLNWSWYLSNDMQFYVVSPLIFVPLFRWRRVGVGLALLWLLATAVTAGVIARVHKFPPSIGLSQADPTSSADYFFDFYIKPYCRFGPYVVGMLTGWALYVTKCQSKMSVFVSVTGWAIATGVALSVVYGLLGAANGQPLTTDASALYNAMHRTAWAACVCWLIFACATGHGGPVNALLSWNAFIPLSRLTYMAYLVHPIIMNMYYLSSPAPFYLSHLNCAMAFLSFTVSSFGVAFFLSLAFEAPMMGLEKVMLASRSKQ